MTGRSSTGRLDRRQILTGLAAAPALSACAGGPMSGQSAINSSAPTTTLIRGGFLYAADAANTVIPESWVLVRNGKIDAIGDSSTAPPPADRVIDATGKMLLPGFVNPHWHESFVEGPDSFSPDDSDLVSTSFSGESNIEGLGRYFSTLVDAEDQMSPEDALIIARYSMWTQLRGGTTMIGDTGSLNSASAMGQAAIDLGMKANVGRWASDIVIPNQGDKAERTHDWRPIAEDWLSIHDEWRNDSTGLVRFMPSVLVSFTSSDEQLAALRGLLDRHDLPYAAHLGALPGEDAANLRIFGKTAIQRFDAHGLLTNRLLAIHTNQIGEADYDKVRQADVRICYSPANYGLLGERSISGTRLAARFLADGAVVSTSTDGNVSFAGGMPEAMRAMHLMVNESMGDNTACTPTMALATGTSAGAIGLGRPETGALVPGKAADIVLVNIDEWRYRLVSHPLSVFLVAGSSADIDTVMVDGNVLIEDGKGVSIDEARLYEDYRRVVYRAHNEVFGDNSAPIR